MLEVIVLSYIPPLAVNHVLFASCHTFPATFSLSAQIHTYSCKTNSDSAVLKVICHVLCSLCGKLSGLGVGRLLRAEPWGNYCPMWISQAADQIKRLYDLFLKVDATQVEVNPLGETPEGQGMVENACLCVCVFVLCLDLCLCVSIMRVSACVSLNVPESC